MVLQRDRLLSVAGPLSDWVVHADAGRVDDGRVLLELGVPLANAMASRLAGSTAANLIAKTHGRRALQRAVTAALATTQREHTSQLGRHAVNRGFFEREGAAELARLLLPGRLPDARRLARDYMTSLPGDSARGSNALVEPFEALLGHLRTELGRHKPFREALAQADAARSDGGDEIDEVELLEWLRGRFEYVATAGLGGSEHIQLKLADVFVAPRVVRETRAGRKWTTRQDEQQALLTERLRNKEISYEDYEALLDRSNVGGPGSAQDGEPIAVTDVLRRNDAVVVLGDPGSGKTTLARYVGLRHAHARLNGSAMIDHNLGIARLPLYVRAGDFARSPRRADGLRAFIPADLATLQCPVKAAYLDTVIERALRSGRCVVLVDGLDEISHAHERARVVASVIDFSIPQLARGNQIICTSRISGYPAAPLPSRFETVRLLEMDAESIERFLGLYAPATELAEAPKKDPRLAMRDGERTVNELLGALSASPGVRRLAASPLLLCALLLVHRTRGALPKRRADSYKAVTEALGDTWRAAQGVPTEELPEERLLTNWLTRLGEWMHRERPEGSAKLVDLLELWGELWAAEHREEWDPGVLDAADPATTRVARSIRTFLDQVERHSGLLVERAPQRWGFPHLTFEEYYAGRALAFEGRARDRPTRIRAHLHDPRYDEPILLALGLLGRDQPEELQAVFESAILATGADARDLELKPSPHEDLLGRDFHFALRALADDIPISPALTDALVGQAIDEALNPSGRALHRVYQLALLDRIRALKYTPAGRRATHLLAQHPAVSTATFADTFEQARFVSVASACTVSKSAPDVIITRLTEIATGDGEPAAMRAALVLGASGALPEVVRRRLTKITADGSAFAATQAAQVLGSGGVLPGPVSRRLTEILISGDHGVATEAAEVLASCGALPQTTTKTLIGLLAEGNEFAATQAAKVLANGGPSSEPTRQAIIKISVGDEGFAATQAAKVLASWGALPGPVSQRLSELLEDNNQLVAIQAANVLASCGALPDLISHALAEMATGDSRLAAMRAAKVLSSCGALPEPVRQRLSRIAMDDDQYAATHAARVLAACGALSEPVCRRLTVILTGNGHFPAMQASEVLASCGALPEPVAQLLTQVLAGDDQFAATLAAQALGSYGVLPEAVSQALTKIATADSQFAAMQAARVLARCRALPESAGRRLVNILDGDNQFAAAQAADVLAGAGPLPTPLVQRLAAMVTRAVTAEGRHLAHQTLMQAALGVRTAD